MPAENHSADVIIVGGGIVGCTAAYYLAKRGVPVLLCEKATVGMEQSSRNWGFVRQQGRNAAELPLMMACTRMWRNLSTELGADLEWLQGGNLALAYDRRRLDLFERWLELAKAHGLETHLLTAQQVRKLVPAARANVLGAMYTPSDGQAEPRKVCPAFKRAAQARRARFFSNCAVKKITTQNGSVSGVLTERGHFRASIVVCTAGAWSTRLLRPLGVCLPSLWVRNSVAQTAPLPAITPAGVWGHAAFRQRRDGRMYVALGHEADHPIMLDSLRFMGAFLPAYLQNTNRLKLKLEHLLAEDVLGRLDDLRRYRVLDPPASARAIEHALGCMRKEYTGLNRITVERTWAGFLDCTPDMLPVIDHPDRPRGLVVAAGFSGHGFGLGPVAGRLISEIIIDGRPSLDLKALRLSRFRERSGRKPVQIL